MCANMLSEFQIVLDGSLSIFVFFPAADGKIVKNFTTEPKNVGSIFFSFIFLGCLFFIFPVASEIFTFLHFCAKKSAPDAGKNEEGDQH